MRSNAARLSSFYKKRGERIEDLKKNKVDLEVQILQEKKVS